MPPEISQAGGGGNLFPVKAETNPTIDDRGPPGLLPLCFWQSLVPIWVMCTCIQSIYSFCIDKRMKGCGRMDRSAVAMFPTWCPRAAAAQVLSGFDWDTTLADDCPFFNYNRGCQAHSP